MRTYADIKCNICLSFLKQKEAFLRKDNGDLEIYYKLGKEYEAHKNTHNEDDLK
jgi:hypothetical protein